MQIVIYVRVLGTPSPTQSQVLKDAAVYEASVNPAGESSIDATRRATAKKELPKVQIKVLQKLSKEIDGLKVRQSSEARKLVGHRERSRFQLRSFCVFNFFRMFGFQWHFDAVKLQPDSLRDVAALKCEWEEGDGRGQFAPASG